MSGEVISRAREGKFSLLLRHCFHRPSVPVRIRLHGKSKWAPWGKEEFGEPTEPIFQTVVIPLAAFRGIVPAQVTEIRFLFNRGAFGTILFDEIGFRSELSK